MMHEIPVTLEQLHDQCNDRLDYALAMQDPAVRVNPQLADQGLESIEYTTPAGVAMHRFAGSLTVISEVVYSGGNRSVEIIFATADQPAEVHERTMVGGKKVSMTLKRTDSAKYAAEVSKYVALNSATTLKRTQ